MNNCAESENSPKNLAILKDNSEESREIKRRIRIGKKYHHVQNNLRKQMIDRVEKKGEKIIDVTDHC